MPTIDQNLNEWQKDYTWPQQGDEWSKVWGGVESHWYWAILPRIHAFLPTATILEIAPGFGRWTQFLKDNCRRLVVVDLSQRCIDSCKNRFSSCSHIAYHTNDGTSLEMVQDNTVDFVFSFDSLVHAELDVLTAYLQQLAAKLTRNGAGFIHHSNLGAFVDRSTGELFSGVTNPHWRAKSVSAADIETICNRVGLQCVSQENVNWGVDHLTDTFTIIAQKNSFPSRSNYVFDNPDFMKEARYIAELSGLYSGTKLSSNNHAVQR